ncbi:MAG: hypothetical protein LIP03_13370, partial [Bacteroidales bacterium]|nr:hypothetical protein [Bacteroidales bacterium]
RDLWLSLSHGLLRMSPKYLYNLNQEVECLSDFDQDDMQELARGIKFQIIQKPSVKFFNETHYIDTIVNINATISVGIDRMVSNLDKSKIKGGIIELSVKKDKNQGKWVISNWSKLTEILDKEYSFGSNNNTKKTLGSILEDALNQSPELVASSKSSNKVILNDVAFVSYRILPQLNFDEPDLNIVLKSKPIPDFDFSKVK